MFNLDTLCPVKLTQKISHHSRVLSDRIMIVNQASLILSDQSSTFLANFTLVISLETPSPNIAIFGVRDLICEFWEVQTLSPK